MQGRLIMKKHLSHFLVLCMFIFCALPVSADKIPAGFKGNYIDVKGQQIRVYQTGSGPDILLIHGLPGCIEDWETIMPELSKKFRVTAFDRPGHGFSSANKLKYNLEQNADFAFALIDKLKLNNPVVVGHSYGGSTVVEMAERNASNVKAFVSVSPVTSSMGKPDIIIYILKTPVIGPASAWLVKLFTGCKMIREGLDEAFDPNQKDIPQGFADTRCMIFSQPKVIKTLSHEEMTMRQDVKKMTPLYGNIKIPLFIVHGGSDKVVPFTDGVLLNKAVPGSKLTLLKNTGHMVQYARPAELIKVIEEASW
jgi:pimeloyl-ACP methyl ester carboxylesterase